MGIISAQSIGEPGTQLTMRTFHIGGAATGSAEQSKQDAKSDGFAKYMHINTVRNARGELIAMNRNGILAILDDKGREKERYPVVYGAKILVDDGAPVKENQDLLEWDPYTFSILTEISGIVHFKDLMEGITMQEQVDEISGNMQLVVTDSPDEKRVPTIIMRPAGGGKHDEKRYLMPTHAHLMVRDGEEVHAGDVLAKIPRATTKTKDITGGLPRVVELFEARKPRERAAIAEINGVIKYGEIAKGQRKVYIVSDDGEQREYSIPRGVHINVQEGERVRAGDPLMDGPRDPHDILHVLGENELQKYMVNEIQEVYRLQGVNINDKHLEVIVRQMMRWVKVEDIGDTEFLPRRSGRSLQVPRGEQSRARGGRRSGNRQAGIARYHEGVIVDRLVHFGGVVPGDNARTHRSRNQRQGRLPARSEGKRHHGPPDPGRYRHGLLPPCEDRRRGCGGRGDDDRQRTRAGGRNSGLRRGCSRAVRGWSQRGHSGRAGRVGCRFR